MNIDRPMVSLFFEIKRSLPFESRDAMKLSAPDIGERLLNIHRISGNQSLKALIEQFFVRAGEDWIDQVGPTKKPFPVTPPKKSFLGLERVSF